ncbi:hypothetical protein KM176_05690 [Pseudooceanicola sp. CBS1P-1]|uniref:Uncharacterized protein n=1 Tax=Pseudooceanicola albus TaxID=2692189 RepID=A0A6L7FY35_9RHOB|nr:MULTISPECIES: hypothetical protein [Pseudooceanicola]MBT9383345.1 hypothetical protein [Pseudooceanicola endophyticus]MXN16332.1 hypothetical protein [Pseudooceanicola albus]
MMALLAGTGWRLLTSRIGLAVMLCGGLWVWHLQDRRAAVETARQGYVRQMQLDAAEAELTEIKRRAAASDAASRVLQERLQASEGDAQRFAAELEAYGNETTVNADCSVDADLLRLLRGR